jgi:hypothetical protein
MTTNMTEFLLWEKASRDTIDFKKIYADMADCDILAGLALSEIVYWHLPNKEGASKLRVEHEGKMWIAVRRYEWWDRTRLTPDQADRALKILVREGLVEKKIYKFNGDPTVHVRIIEDRFLSLWNELSNKEIRNPFAPEKNSISAESQNGIALNGSPLTETTLSLTTEIKDLKREPQVSGPQTPPPAEKKAPVKKEPPNTDLLQIAQTLSVVCKLDFAKNRGRLFREAKLFKVEEIPQIQKDYSPGGAWYLHDWRGQKGEAPTPNLIRETWNKLKPAPVPHAAPQESLRERYYRTHPRQGAVNGN